MLWIVKNAGFVMTSKLCKRKIGDVTRDFTLISTLNFIKRCVNYIIMNFLETVDRPQV